MVEAEEDGEPSFRTQSKANLDSVRLEVKDSATATSEGEEEEEEDLCRDVVPDQTLDG